MSEFVSRCPPGEMIALTSIIGGLICGTIVLIAGYWRKIRQAEIDAKLKKLRERGVWVSAPTGNHNFTTGISWPACQPNCFAIGAVRRGKDEVYLDRRLIGQEDRPRLPGDARAASVVLRSLEPVRLISAEIDAGYRARP